MDCAEFNALNRGLRSIPEKKSPAPEGMPGWMHPQSTDGRALRLHSCRALSSQPQEPGYMKKANFGTVPVDKPHTCLFVAIPEFCNHLSDFGFKDFHRGRRSPHRIVPRRLQSGTGLSSTGGAGHQFDAGQVPGEPDDQHRCLETGRTFRASAARGMVAPLRRSRIGSPRNSCHG